MYVAVVVVVIVIVTCVAGADCYIYIAAVIIGRRGVLICVVGYIVYITCVSVRYTLTHHYCKKKKNTHTHNM